MFTITKSRFLLALTVLVLASLACNISFSIGTNGGTAPTQEVVVSNTQTVEVPLIDQFGPELTLPGTVYGPAIANIWDGEDYCATVKVNVGETLDWNKDGYAGAYWQAWSQDALDARFPHHADEYLALYPKCLVLQSTDTTVSDDVPLIDQFDAESTLPGTVYGPAILNIWDGANYCATVKLNAGETLDWNKKGYAGAYWQAWSQDALDARFPHHADEYLALYPKCIVLQSADLIPASLTAK